MLSFWVKANHEQDVIVFNPRYDRGSIFKPRRIEKKPRF